MSFETLINDNRSISRLTVAINSVIAQQIFDGRANRPWIYDDTQRMLGVAWNLDLAPLMDSQHTGDHYALVSETQAPLNSKLEALGKLLADELEVAEKPPVKSTKKAAA